LEIWLFLLLILGIKSISKEYENSNILILESYLYKKERKNISEIFFEKFGVKRLNFSYRGLGALISTGRVTGAVLRCGHTSSFCINIIDGDIKKESFQKTKYSGRDINKELTVRLNNNILDDDEINFIKENYIEIETKESKVNDIVSYELPDGKKINIGKERFECCEILFKEIKHGLLIKDSISKWNSLDYINELYTNIILVGCTTKIKNYKEKIFNDLSSENEKKIYTCQSNSSTWVGGSILGSLSTYKKIFKTNKF
jgi:actin-related protein